MRAATDTDWTNQWHDGDIGTSRQEHNRVVLATPGFGGARLEDVYRVTRSGGEILWPYPILPELTG